MTRATHQRLCCSSEYERAKQQPAHSPAHKQGMAATRGAAAAVQAYDVANQPQATVSTRHAAERQAVGATASCPGSRLSRKRTANDALSESHATGDEAAARAGSPRRLRAQNQLPVAATRPLTPAPHARAGRAAPVDRQVGREPAGNAPTRQRRPREKTAKHFEYRQLFMRAAITNSASRPASRARHKQPCGELAGGWRLARDSARPAQPQAARTGTRAPAAKSPAAATRKQPPHRHAGAQPKPQCNSAASGAGAYHGGYSFHTAEDCDEHGDRHQPRQRACSAAQCTRLAIQPGAAGRRAAHPPGGGRLPGSQAASPERPQPVPPQEPCSTAAAAARLPGSTAGQARLSALAAASQPAARAGSAAGAQVAANAGMLLKPGVSMCHHTVLALVHSTASAGGSGAGQRSSVVDSGQGAGQAAARGTATRPAPLHGVAGSTSALPALLDAAPPAVLASTALGHSAQPHRSSGRQRAPGSRLFRMQPTTVQELETAQQAAGFSWPDPYLVPAAAAPATSAPGGQPGAPCLPGQQVSGSARTSLASPQAGLAAEPHAAGLSWHDPYLVPAPATSAPSGQPGASGLPGQQVSGSAETPLASPQAALAAEPQAAGLRWPDTYLAPSPAAAAPATSAPGGQPGAPGLPRQQVSGSTETPLARPQAALAAEPQATGLSWPDPYLVPSPAAAAPATSAPSGQPGAPCLPGQQVSGSARTSLASPQAAAASGATAHQTANSLPVELPAYPVARVAQEAALQTDSAASSGGLFADVETVSSAQLVSGAVHHANEARRTLPAARASSEQAALPRSGRCQPASSVHAAAPLLAEQFFSSRPDLATAPHLNRYDAYDKHLVRRLCARAQQRGLNAAAVLTVRERFVRLALEARAEGGRPPAPRDTHQAVVAYAAMLRQVYGGLVLEPHRLPAAVMDLYSQPGAAEELHVLRTMQRRFIIYDPPHTGSAGSQPGAVEPGAGLSQSCSAAALPLAGTQQQAAQEAQPCRHSQPGNAGVHTTCAEPAASRQEEAGGHSPGPGGQPGSAAWRRVPWDRQMGLLWQRTRRELLGTKGQKQRGGVPYRAVQEPDVPTKFSCRIAEQRWQGGLVDKVDLPPGERAAAALAAVEAGADARRLYFTDGTIPAYAECGLDASSPGLCCLVDRMSNAMLPPAWRSDRADSLLHFLKIESSGVANFVLFAAVGAPAVTAFHQETKQRRSWNCGSGDMIVQPLATAANMRKLARVHAAVWGAAERARQVMALEAYLEEGISLVLALRQGPTATMVELPEQSCHTFITWATTAATPPCLKVSCNDWCLRSEVLSAYLLEKLALAGCGAGGGPARAPAEEADTWVESSYLPLEPARLDQLLGGAWPRPWAEELQAAGGRARGAAQLQGREARCWRMEVVVVRTAEKLLDGLAALRQAAAAGQPPPAYQPWAGAQPSAAQALEALRELLPALLDMHERALAHLAEPAPASPDAGSAGRPSAGTDEGSSACAGGAGGEGGAHFTRGYLDILITQVDKACCGFDIGSPKRGSAALLANYLRAAPGPARTLIAYNQGLEGPAAQLTAPNDEPLQLLRGRWLLALQREWEAAVAVPRDDAWLANRQAQRVRLEEAMDRRCTALLHQRAPAWAAAAGTALPANMGL